MTPTQERIIIEALSWEGTPYHHHARIKGVGVDCAMLLCEVFEVAGLVPHVDPGNYPPDWHFHQNGEMYRDWLEKYAIQVEGEPQAGDVVLYKFGRVGSHAAIVLQYPEVIHAYIREGCVRGDSENGWLKDRRDSVWRVRGVE
jgi:NlpC/P60 family putative phage cell wall peptidase